MIIVDTPGTNVILQRQQQLTEEFVPRADLLLFVMSADRPLTESEVWTATAMGVMMPCNTVSRTSLVLENSLWGLSKNYCN